jgi:hypothetical protein
MVNEKYVGTFVDTHSLPQFLQNYLLLPDSEQRSCERGSYKSMPDDHSKLVPPLPIPNRTVKQLCADDSAATSVKVGYRQASYKEKAPSGDPVGAFLRLYVCNDRQLSILCRQ